MATIGRKQGTGFVPQPNRRVLRVGFESEMEIVVTAVVQDNGL